MAEVDERVVVVGSGFGGAVTALRLAQAGVDVTVLERGRRWPPGSFPRRSSDRWAWQRDHGPFDIRVHDDIALLLAAGVGGGSLLYSSVHLRMPSALLETWAGGWSRDRLDPYYDLVANMLDLRPVAEDQPWGIPRRTGQFERAVVGARQTCPVRPPLAVNLAGDPTRKAVNRFGVLQAGCRHCGKCSIGCNHAAKNSLDTNYLPLASRRGAVVRPRHEVVALNARDGGGYRVVACDHETDRHETIDCGVLVLAAGAVGTTELLLENSGGLAEDGPLSDHLGRRYSANGDLASVMAFTDESFGTTRGPAITSAYLNGPDPADDGRWFLVQDGGVPPFVTWRGLLRGLLDPDDLEDWLRRAPFLPDAEDPAIDIGAESLVDHLAIFLGMGPDSADGVVRRDGAGVAVDWPRRANEGLYAKQERLMDELGDVLGTETPAGAPRRLARRAVSVHSLGGAVMGANRDEGVVDHEGRVFGTKDVYVFDGAALPTSTGVNPSHTIAAVAERNVERLIHRLGRPRWEAPGFGTKPAFEDPLPWPTPKGAR